MTSRTSRRRAGSGARSALPFAIAVLASFLGVVSPVAVTEVAAATPDLTIVTAARYEVRPKDRLVHVTLDATAVNHKSDTKLRRYYFDTATIAVMPGTTRFRATASGRDPSVTVARTTKDYRLLRVSFGRRVYSHQTFRFRLGFDLPDRGGAATRDVRVGQSLVAFPVWAFATNGTSGSSVAVVFPTGYTVHVDQGSLNGPTRTSSTQVLRRDGIGDASAFFAYVSGDRSGAFAETRTTTSVDGRTVQLAIRPWTDDRAWGRRVADLFVRGLPAIGDLVGVAYPRTDQLVVQEAVTRSTGGYAGLFDPGTGRIEVAYYASAFVVLHEAAHAWFNGALLADRWADEGFASYYAELAAKQLHLDVSPPRLTADLRAAKIPLNGWQAVGRASNASESYAYAATLEVARAIGARAGTDGLAKVWAAASAGEAADQPVHAAPGSAPDISPAGAADWRTLLDLLETRTGKAYDDLWRTWVVRPDEAALLDRRTSTRAAYADTVSAAGDWELPGDVRRVLDAWQFDQADALLAQARAVLDRRGALESAASAAGLALPDAVRRDFEGGASLRVALNEADAEIAAIAAIDAAERTRPGDPDPLTQLGLLTSTPDRSIADARTAFAQGRLADAVASADAARAAWTSAPDVGRELATRIAIAALVLVLVLVLVARAVLRRRAGSAESARVARDAPPRPRDAG